MDLEEFKQTLSRETPLPAQPLELQALWWEAKGHWDKAHRMVQNLPGPAAAWVHAYLHRKEGDQSNADYWYSRARRPTARGSLEGEWKAIASEFLERGVVTRRSY